MTPEECLAALDLALTAAQAAHKALRDQVLVPKPPQPTVRVLHLPAKVELRGTRNGRDYGDFLWCDGSSRWNSTDLRTIVCEAISWDPRRLLRIVRRIQAWTAYVNRLAEGRARHAAEICRQQASAVDALKAELALDALTKGE